MGSGGRPLGCYASNNSGVRGGVEGNKRKAGGEGLLEREEGLSKACLGMQSADLL